MIRFLQWFNLAGVVALAVLCSFQWKANRKANLELITLDGVRLAQASKIVEQDAAIKGYAEDNEDLRDRLSHAESSLDETTRKLAVATVEVKKLTAERDELKTALDTWKAAVAERDAALKQAREQMEKLGKERNEAVTKFNDLAAKYNGIVKEVNESRTKPTSK
jgi:chromosome segregation ATPase